MNIEPNDFKLKKHLLLAREIIKRGVSIMTLLQLNQWEGVQAWIDNFPDILDIDDLCRKLLTFIKIHDFTTNNNALPLFLDDALRKFEGRTAIYCLVDSDRRVVKYVGQSKNPYARKAEHNGNRVRRPWYMVVMYVCDNENANKIECDCINWFSSYNSGIGEELHNRTFQSQKNKTLPIITDKSITDKSAVGGVYQCKTCGTDYIARTTWQKFCSETCKSEYWYKRN